MKVTNQDKTVNSRKLVLRIFIIFIFATAIFAMLPFGIFVQKLTAQAENAPQLITTRAGLKDAISTASDGDIILVGDIDFSLPSTSHNYLRRVIVDKSITIRSAKQDGCAVFSGGSFNIVGPSLANRKISCVFEGIIFDGGIDGASLTATDWEIDPDNRFTYEPEKAQYAMTFWGNVDAVIANCKFNGYMNGYGGAICADYSEDSSDEDCELNVLFSDCDFNQNAARYGGGAVYLRGTVNKNIIFTANNCSFTENITSGLSVTELDFGGGFIFTSVGYPISMGGGAVYGRNAQMTLKKCSITGNSGNHWYSGSSDPTFYDANSGGGILVHNSILMMTDCLIADNNASVGGGIAIISSKIIIDGCVIADNGAYTDYPDDYWSAGGVGSSGLGGGIYINITPAENDPPFMNFINTSIYNNFAQDGYGGLYSTYHGYGFEDTEILLTLDFCAYAFNTSGRAHNYNSAWQQGWGDIWEIPYVLVRGSIISDEAYPKDEKPTDANNYNYLVPDASDLFNGYEDAAEYSHLYPKTMTDELVVPLSFFENITNGRFTKILGTIYCGDNYNPCVTVKLDAKNGRIKSDELTVGYSQTIIIPEPSREGYAFTAWRNADGEEFNAEGLFFGADITTLTLYADWERIDSPFPGWAIALIVSGCIVLLLTAVGTVAFIRRKKVAVETAGSPVMPNNNITPVNGNLDRLAKEYSLTSREKEITALIAAGKPPTIIAGELFISVDTVKTHTKNIYEKLGIHRKYELLEKLKNS